MPETTFTIAVNADDGYVGGNAGSYPITSGTHANSGAVEIGVDRSWFSELSSYYTRNGLLRWDTSSIPDTATVVGARLVMRNTGVTDTDGLSATGEWYSWSTPMATSNFTPTPATTAFSVPLASFTPNDYNTIFLSSPDANINKGGYTGLRLHTTQRSADAAPSGQNRHLWACKENVSGYTAPQLVVNYIEAPAFRQKSEGSGTVSSGSNVSVTMPSGTTEDDRMLLGLTIQGGTNVTITPPSGWTLVDRRNSTTLLGTAIYEKTAASSEAGPYAFGISISGGGTAKYGYICASYYTADVGVAGVDVASSVANTASTSVVSPTIDTLVGSSLVLFLGASAVGGTSGATWTPPSGMTERADVASGTSTGSSSIKKFYLMGGTLTNSYQPTQEDGTAPGDGPFAAPTGWIVGTEPAADMSPFKPNIEQAVTTFTATAVPTALGTGANANAFRTTNALTGTFAAGNWTLSAVLRSVTAAMATGQTGRLRWRVYKSANADGTSATELTSGVVLSNTVAGTGNTTANQGTRTATWSASQITLSSEYLFFACAYEVVAASGTGATRDANFRQNTNSAITTPTFTLPTDVALELADAPQTSAGPTGTKTATSQNSGINTAALVALSSPIPGVADKDLEILWDVRGRVDAGRGLAPAIGLAPSGSLPPQGAALHIYWDVGVATLVAGQSADILYDLRALAAGQRSLLYNISALAGQQRSLLYDIRGLAGQSRVASYDLRALAGQPRQLLYNVSALAGQPRQLLYNVSGRAGQPRNVLYDVYGKAGAQRQLLFDLYARAAQSRQLLYDVRGLSGQSRQVLYDILANALLAGASRQVLYDVRALAAGQRQLLYDVYGKAGAQRQILYDVYTKAGAQRQILYDLYVKAAQSRQILYDLRALAGQPRQLLYDVRGLAAGQRNILYDIRALSGQSRQILYNVLATTLLAGASRTLLYDVRGYARGDRQVLYDIYTKAAQQRQLLYDIYTKAGQQRQLLYDIRGLAGQPRNVLYDVRGRAQGSRIVSYDVYAKAAQQRQIRYDINALAAAQRQIRYDIRGLAGAQRVIFYNILSHLIVLQYSLETALDSPFIVEVRADDPLGLEIITDSPFDIDPSASR